MKLISLDLLMAHVLRRRMANIVSWDLETSNLNANIGFIICGGWKTLGRKVTMRSIDNYPLFKYDPTDDSEIVEHLREDLAKADMWVTWFGTHFDIPYMQSKLLEHGMKPLPEVPHVDGWKIARYKLKLTSNRLATVTGFLGLEDKTKVDFKVWRRAAAGHRPSIKYIKEHCKIDCDVLEDVYEKIKPFCTTHPNVAIMDGKPRDRCTVCGVAGKLVKQGFRITKLYRAQRYQCGACGTWASGRLKKVEGAGLE